MDTTTCARECTDRDGTPRPATVGVLCAHCWQTLARTIDETPALINHLYDTANTAGIQATRYDRDTTPGNNDPSETTVLHPAWLAADELEHELTYWADAMAHARGVPRTTEPAEWLNTHLEWIASRYGVVEFRDTILRSAAVLKARWPTADMVERERHIPNVPCPRCGHINLTYWPTTTYKQPAQVACGNPDCARIYTDDEWERQVHIIANAKAAGVA